MLYSIGGYCLHNKEINPAMGNKIIDRMKGYKC